MSVRNSRHVFLGAGAVALVAALSLFAWMTLVDKSPDIPSISVLELLEEMQSRNTTVESYRYTMTSRQTPQTKGDPELQEGTTEVTFVFNEGTHIVSQGGVPGGDHGYSETLILEGKQYSRRTADGAWEQVSRRGSDPSDERRKLTSNGHAQMLRELNNLAVAGAETLNGIRVRKVTGQYDVLAKANAIWNGPDNIVEGSEDLYNQMVAGTEKFTGWIGVEDGLLHAHELNGSYPAAGEFMAFTLWYRIEFHDLNEQWTLPSVS